jgi:NADH:ubiquinone oxidoreductase subunit E
MSEKIIHKNVPDNILLALEEGQARFGYISPEFMTELAESLDIPVNDVYGVASFYSFITTRPPGRNIIRICRSLPCHMKEGEAIIKAIEIEIGIKPGNTTEDGRFSYEMTNCIGLCDGAPAMLINHDAYIKLTPEKITDILAKYK